MTSDAENPSVDDFFRLAERLEYATPESLARLAEECRQTSVAPETLALRKGLLDAIEIEIIGTLLRPKETVPGYEILSVLGKGGMGIVYEAKQLNLGRTVALKTVLVSRMGSASALSRFEQEARTVAQLQHPNIVGGYDFGRSDGRVFFAMELVQGEELADLIKRKGSLDERLAWGIARQTAAGLAHAANHGVVHRDIKPGNLLLVEPPEGVPFPPDTPLVKIADFGLAILTNADESGTRLTSDNTTVGSPHYMAPEQFQQSDVDLRADIYSLGATVFQMLSGKPPFDGSNLTQIMAGKLAGRLTPLEELRPGLSPRTYELLDRMMAQSAENRPESYPELLSLIDSLCPDLFGDTTTAASSAPTTALATAQRAASTANTDAVGSRTESEFADAQSATDTISNRRQILVKGFAGVASAGGAAWWFLQLPKNAAPPVRLSKIRMKDLGPSLRLFNGANTAGWQQRSGNWIVPPQSAMLEGTNGLLVKPLFKKGDGQPQPIELYRLIVFVDRAEAESAEVQFGFAPHEQRNGPRYVLHFTKEGISVGERASDGDDFRPLGNTPPAQFNGEAAAIIERQPGGWFLSINERPLAALPRRPNGELPEIRLATKGGPARFSEITLTELAAGS
ncbi:MAG: serine/threonine-protein kinase [Planctomycetota bacterium]|nr:serine/threonine-protein kinase [Planctomycetota bacterium]MDA1160170.1 serine/threonine-protein kinase [Planctomycetota bacterium]